MTGRRFRAAAAISVAVAVMAVGGCSGQSESSSAPTSSGSPSGTPDANPCHHLKPASGPTAAKFGAAQVTAGECEMSLLTLKGSFLPKLMQAVTFAKADFAPFRAYMTPVARRAWDADVAKLSASGIRDRSALNAVLSLTYVDVAGHTYTLGNSTTTQPVSHRKLLSGRVRLVSVHGTPRLRIALKISFRFNLTDRNSGRPLSVDGTKAVAYTLAPNPGGAKDKPFLIDGWHGASRFGKVKAASTG
jgi:hypothetical protein